MKVLALDVGDQWTGSAISDPMGIFARPYQTVATTQLQEFIATTIEQEKIELIIVGHPKTLRGTASAQTEKTERLKKKLEEQFPTVEWKLWDERLTSKMASRTKKAKNKKEKLKSHSIAAAFILDSYLSYLQNQKNMQ
ncbi:Holliday junction resolvase RuvX [Candidatus Dependentiae bacterium]